MKKIKWVGRLKSKTESERYSEIDSSVSEAVYKFYVYGKITEKDSKLLRENEIFVPVQGEEERRNAYMYADIDFSEMRRRVNEINKRLNGE